MSGLLVLLVPLALVVWWMLLGAYEYRKLRKERRSADEVLRAALTRKTENE
jgi:hypothetical protein